VVQVVEQAQGPESNPSTTTKKRRKDLFWFSPWSLVPSSWTGCHGSRGMWKRGCPLMVGRKQSEEGTACIPSDCYLPRVLSQFLQPPPKAPQLGTRLSTELVGDTARPNCNNLSLLPQTLSRDTSKIQKVEITFRRRHVMGEKTTNVPVILGGTWSL
jgi:hypothetical protein